MYSKVVFLLIFGLTTSCESVINSNNTNSGKDTKGSDKEVPKASYSTLLVRHSQYYSVSECPVTFSKLWEGYSLIYTEENGISQNQDLGKPGSCVRKFSTTPFLSCNYNEVCHYAARNVRSYWLSTNELCPVIPPQVNDLHRYISRCVVCEAPVNVLVVHSQSNYIPNCPIGWQELWIGYSFVMYGGAGGQGGGLPLESPGSCLENFVSSPLMECDSGVCNKYADHQSYWLAAVPDYQQFQRPTMTVYKAGYNLVAVSRCTVCIKHLQ